MVLMRTTPANLGECIIWARLTRAEWNKSLLLPAYGILIPTGHPIQSPDELRVFLGRHQMHVKAMR